MKYLKLYIKLLTVLFFFTLLSCEQEEPELPLSDQITGEYEVDYYLVGGFTKVTLPLTVDGITVTAKLSIRRVSESNVSAVFTFIQTASSFGISDVSTSSVASIPLSKSSIGEIVGSDSKGNSIIYNNGEVEVLLINDNDTTKNLTIHGIAASTQN